MQPEDGKQAQQSEVTKQQGATSAHGSTSTGAAATQPPGVIATAIGALGLVTAAVVLLRLGALRASPRAAILVILIAGFFYATFCLSMARNWKCWGSGHRNKAVVAILAIALILRVVLLFSSPSLSDDIFRYRWDGKVQAAGLNPYTEPPASAALEPLRDEHWESINYPRIRSIYPPLTQLLFASTYAIHHSVKAFQAMATLGDLLTIALMLVLIRTWNLPRWYLALYACHPLPAIEFASSGHFDAWAIAAVLGAIVAHTRRRGKTSTAALAAGVLLKTWPLVFLPLLLRRRPLWHVALFAGLIVLAFAPFAGAGWGLLQPWLEYTGRWRFNDGAFFLLAGATGSLEAGKAIAAALGLALFAWLWRRDDDPVHSGYWLLLGFIALMPTIQPWYMLWALPLAALSLDLGWITLCTLAPLAYWILTSAGADSNAWVEPLWPRFAEYLPALAVWVWQTRRRGWVAAPGRTCPGDQETGTAATESAA